MYDYADDFIHQTNLQLISNLNYSRIKIWQHLIHYTAKPISDNELVFHLKDSILHFGQ